MPVEVKIPPMLRTHVGGERVLSAPSGDLREVLADLGSRYSGLAEQVFADDGSLHRFVNVYVNDEDVRFLEGLDTKVGDGDVVAILPAVAGG
ncbi:MAG TPA: ubiquitin-like small modifier protein 1 [Actinomycetota bacterium]|jgi:molybdopterin converting factor small subunit